MTSQRTLEPRSTIQMWRMSPRRVARAVGILDILIILNGMFAQGFVSNRLIVWVDPATTANNILAHEALYRVSFTVFMVEMGCQAAVIALLYGLLKPVNRNISLLTACLGLVGCIVKTVARMFYFAPLLILGGTQHSGAFSVGDLQSLALVFLEVNNWGAGMGLAFLGLSACLKGYLIFRSAFLPRVLGVFSMAAGATISTYLYPPLGDRLFPIIVVLGLVAAVPQIVWFLTVGVNEARWNEQAGLAGTERG
jgi:hypothetical protein